MGNLIGKAFTEIEKRKIKGKYRLPRGRPRRLLDPMCRW